MAQFSWYRNKKNRGVEHTKPPSSSLSYLFLFLSFLVFSIIYLVTFLVSNSIYFGFILGFFLLSIDEVFKKRLIICDN